LNVLVKAGFSALENGDGPACVIELTTALESSRMITTAKTTAVNHTAYMANGLSLLARNAVFPRNDG